jgi:peptide/nickel transport system substrate-binding protein
MFQNGELDLIDLQTLDSAIVQATYKTMYEDQIVSTPKVGMSYLTFNENQEYLKDVNVRKAISMAVDVDKIIASIYNGDAIRENGIIPSGIWSHNDDFQAPAYDPDGAKKLLADAGYKEGEISFEIAMDSSSDGSIKLVGNAISQQLEQIGIHANVKNYDHAIWLDLRSSSKMDSFVATWGMDYNDPANIMYTFFGNEKNTAQRSLNYPDKEIMQRVAAASAIVDDAQRKAEYQDLEKKIIGEDAAWLPLFETLHLYCKGERVESFTPQWAGFTDFYVTDVVLK